MFDGRDILYLLRETPNLHLVSNVRVGSRLPAHATTIGRIILAHWPTDKLAQAVANMDLAAVTSKTSTTPEALIEQLNGDRTLGIAWSVGNFESGIGSAAAAVFDSSGAAVGAINVTGPEAEFRPRGGRRSEISAKLMAAAMEISQQLGHFPTAGRAVEQGGQKK